MKLKLFTLLLLMLTLSACGSKRLKSDQVTEDITRPPQIEVSNDALYESLTKEKKETVSYEEWLKENAEPTPASKPALEQ